MVEILDEMTEEEGLKFMEVQQTAPWPEGEAHHKVYLIPSGDKVIIISKTNHMICDGLSIYHMWSLLQDGTPEEVWENRIRIPEKKAYDPSYNSQIR